MSKLALGGALAFACLVWQGCNYTSELMSIADLPDHCNMVVAIRKDIGL